jgi:hypothetical protein
VHHAASCGHQVYGPGVNGLHRPQAVSMSEFAIEQVGKRCQSDVGMGRNLHALAWWKCGRSHVIEEHERPD